MSRTHVFVGASLDGFIAGPNDELDWLGGGEGETPDTFAPFLAQMGVVLMGRRTYDVVCGFKGPWPYGETPMLIATHRELTTKHPTARAVTGDIGELIAEARRVAAPRGVYVDGGALIRSALDAGLIDDITVTIVPTVIGRGIPLFAGVHQRHRLELVSERALKGGAVELKYRTKG